MLDWRHVDLKLGAVELAADEEGRKPGGSWRVVPLVKPLRKRLREAWIAQGRPTEGKVCPPRQHSPSGMLAARRHPAARHARVARARAGADRAARVAAHGGDVARSRGRVAQGRVDADGPQDARVPAGRRVDHAAALHAHAAGRAGAGARSARPFLVERTGGEAGRPVSSFPRASRTAAASCEPAPGLKPGGASKPVSRRSPAVGRFDSCAAPLRFPMSPGGCGRPPRAYRRPKQHTYRLLGAPRSAAVARDERCRRPVNSIRVGSVAATRKPGRSARPERRRGHSPAAARCRRTDPRSGPRSAWSSATVATASTCTLSCSGSQ